MAEHNDVTMPKHYDLFPDGTQAIDVIEAALTPEEFAGFLKGNFLKYRLRAGDKGPADKCLAKARWYQDYLRRVDRANKVMAQALDGWSPDAVRAAAFPGTGAFGPIGGEWPPEDRIDALGQNGPTGEHYGCQCHGKKCHGCRA